MYLHIILLTLTCFSLAGKKSDFHFSGKVFHFSADCGVPSSDLLTFRKLDFSFGQA
jgi:hypothetical protein